MKGTFFYSKKTILGSDLIVQKVAVKIFWVSATEQEFFLQKYVSKHVRASKLLEFRTFFSWCSKPSGKLYPWIFLLHSTLLKWSFWNKTEFKGMQMTQGTIYLSKFFLTNLHEVQSVVMKTTGEEYIVYKKWLLGKKYFHICL